MAAKPLPPQSVLLQLLRYEPETGKLYWRERPAEMFSSGGKNPAKMWNTRYANQEAFTVIEVRGYKRGVIFDTDYLAHRVIVKMMTGVDPDQVDHIDGIRINNRWNNLRDVSGSVNQRNSSMKKNNTSGFTGVHWDKSVRKWRAMIMNGGKNIDLGAFTFLDDAVAARKAANVTYDYSPRHGAQR